MQGSYGGLVVVVNYSRGITTTFPPNKQILTEDNLVIMTEDNKPLLTEDA